MNHLKKALLGAALVAATSLAAAAANAAVVVTMSNGPDNQPLPFGQTVLLDFESPAPVGVLSGDYNIVSGGLGGEYAAPWQDMTNYIVVPADGSPAPATASIDVVALVGGPVHSFSFYWGSNDTHNEVRLYDTSNNLIHTTVGTGNGAQALPLTNQRYNFTLIGADTSLGRIELYSNGKAFEADDFAFQSGVPEPATWAMMIVGFGAVGGMARNARRRQVAAFA